MTARGNAWASMSATMATGGVKMPSAEEMLATMKDWNRGGRPPKLVNEVRVWDRGGFALALARSGKFELDLLLNAPTFRGIPIVLDRGLPDGVVELRNADGETCRIVGVG